MWRPRSAALKPARGWMPGSCGSCFGAWSLRKTGCHFSGLCSWPRPRTGDRQPVADIGQIIFEIAIFVVLRIERYAANLGVAGGEAPADRSHAAPFGTIDRHGIQDPERGCEHFGAYPLAGTLHVTGCAGEIELSPPGIEIALAVLIGLERARIVRDFDVERLAARCERHIGSERGHFVFHIGEGRFAVDLAAAVQRQFERNDLAFLLVEVWIVLSDADALVREAIGVALAVLEGF